MRLQEGYRPLTACPYGRGEDYCEVLPGLGLRKYVRCFWGTERPCVYIGPSSQPLVIPDSCLDLIFTVDHEKGTVEACFCGMDDSPGPVNNRVEWKCRTSRFGIRLYPWAVSAFSEDSLRGSRGCREDAEARFSRLSARVAAMLLETEEMGKRIRFAEELLLGALRPHRRQEIAAALFGEILAVRGAADVAELCRTLPYSTRQVERLSVELTGLSPKGLMNIVRYQLVWQDVLRGSESYPDLVAKYGYSDQAHLCHQFRRYHSMSPRQARELALESMNRIQTE